MKPKSYLRIPLWWPSLPKDWRGWLPSRGNVLFTLVIAGLLVLAQSVGALPLGRLSTAPASTSTGTVAYQGRLADAAGAPLTGTYNMIFRLYDAAASGTPLWEEQWTGSNGVRVSDGLFNVMLGSLTAMPQDIIAGHDQLFLGITVGTDDEMAPRVQLGSVPFAVQALTIPDGSVSTAKIADGAVTSNKLSRKMTSSMLSSDMPLPNTSTWYDILSASVTLDRETLVTIYGSIRFYNLTADQACAALLVVDGADMLISDNWKRAGTPAVETATIALILGPGQHQIVLRGLTWQGTSATVAHNGTQLIVVEG